MVEPIVVLKDVHKTYDYECHALDGLNLSVAQGEFMGLLGPNGSGKTTTINILAGLLKPSSGEIQVNGMNVATEAAKIKSSIGIVPQNIALYPSLTLVENLRYFASLYGLQGQYLRQRIEYCIEVASLEKFAHKLVGKYSGGMQRRANLVCGIIHQPEILLLDEPTVNVDPQSRHVIFNTLQRFNQEGMTIFYTTHYLEEAQRLCSQLAIIDAGKIVAQGTVQEIINLTPESTDLAEAFLILTGAGLRA